MTTNYLFSDITTNARVYNTNTEHTLTIHYIDKDGGVYRYIIVDETDKKSYMEYATCGTPLPNHFVVLEIE